MNDSLRVLLHLLNADEITTIQKVTTDALGCGLIALPLVLFREPRDQEMAEYWAAELPVPAWGGRRVHFREVELSRHCCAVFSRHFRARRGLVPAWMSAALAWALAAGNSETIRLHLQGMLEDWRAAVRGEEIQR